MENDKPNLNQQHQQFFFNQQMQQQSQFNQMQHPQALQSQIPYFQNNLSANQEFLQHPSLNLANLQNHGYLPHSQKLTQPGSNQLQTEVQTQKLQQFTAPTQQLNHSNDQENQMAQLQQSLQIRQSNQGLQQAAQQSSLHTNQQMNQFPNQLSALFNQYQQKTQQASGDQIDMQLLQNQLLQQMQGFQQSQAQNPKLQFPSSTQLQNPLQGPQLKDLLSQSMSDQQKQFNQTAIGEGPANKEMLNQQINLQKWMNQSQNTKQSDALIQQLTFPQTSNIQSNDIKHPQSLQQLQSMANSLQQDNRSLSQNLLQNFNSANNMQQILNPQNSGHLFTNNQQNLNQALQSLNDPQQKLSHQIDFDITKLQQKQNNQSNLQENPETNAQLNNPMFFMPSMQSSSTNQKLQSAMLSQNNMALQNQMPLQQNNLYLQGQQLLNNFQRQQLQQLNQQPPQQSLSQQLLMKPQDSQSNIHFQQMYMNQSMPKPAQPQLQPPQQMPLKPLVQQPQIQVQNQATVRPPTLPLNQQQVSEQNTQSTNLLQFQLQNPQLSQNLGNQNLQQQQNVQLQAQQSENSAISTFQKYSKMAEFFGTKGDYQQAIQYYLKMTEIDPENGPSWAAIGHCYLLSDDINKAFNAYQQALYCLEDIRDPQLWYGIGILYEKFESYDHAISALIAVLKMSPNFQQKSELLYKLGVILAKTNQLDQSVRYFQNSILASNFSLKRRVDTQLKIGILYELQCDFVQAQQSYELAKSHNKNYHKVYQHLAWCSFQQGQIIEALDQIDKAESRQKDNLDSLYIKGRCYLVLQKFQEAEECFTAVKNKQPTDAIFWTSYAILLFLQNKFTESFEAIIKASTLKPDLCEIWYNLGILYEKCNQPEEANIAFQKVLELQPGHTETLSRLMSLTQNGEAQNRDDSKLIMKHPFYCVSNSLVILKKYWSLDSYERCVAIQNQPFQNINVEQMHNFDQAIDIESVQKQQINDQQQAQQNQQNVFAELQQKPQVVAPILAKEPNQKVTDLQMQQFQTKDFHQFMLNQQQQQQWLNQQHQFLQQKPPTQQLNEDLFQKNPILQNTNQLQLPNQFVQPLMMPNQDVNQQQNEHQQFSAALAQAQLQQQQQNQNEQNQQLFSFMQQHQQQQKQLYQQQQQQQQLLQPQQHQKQAPQVQTKSNFTFTPQELERFQSSYLLPQNEQEKHQDNKQENLQTQDVKLSLDNAQKLKCDNLPQIQEETPLIPQNQEQMISMQLFKAQQEQQISYNKFLMQQNLQNQLPQLKPTLQLQTQVAQETKIDGEPQMQMNNQVSSQLLNIALAKAQQEQRQKQQLQEEEIDEEDDVNDQDYSEKSSVSQDSD